MLGDLARLGVVTPARAAAFRARVTATGYAERRPLPAETSSITNMPEELRAPVVAWALARDRHPAAGLALLFQHLLPVPLAVIDRALGKEIREWLTDAGILIDDDTGVRSRFQMVVADGVFLWSDHVTGGADAVMTPGPTTADLVNVLPDRVGGSFLDVGTGPGTLGLIAKRRGADTVVTTDVNDRALSLTRFNASFNELRVDVRAGDLFAPVGDERFDWVVSQPPYVTHPSDEPGVTFLHGGDMGDEIAFRFLSELSSRLRTNGIGLALFDSPVRPGAGLHERVRKAIGDRVDVAVFSQPGLGPDRQALGYAALTDPTFGPRYRESAVRYRAHLAQQRIEAVTHSMIVARSPAQGEHAGWTASLTVPRFPKDWDEIRVFMRGIDLAVAGEDAIAAARVRARDAATVTIERAPGGTRDDEKRSICFAAPSIALDRELTQAGAVIFDLLAAEPSVASAIERFAAAMERPAADVRPLVTDFVRDCLMRALLVPD
jgi:predicted RNA methylase